MNICIDNCLNIISLYQYSARVFEKSFCNSICCFKISKQVLCPLFHGWGNWGPEKDGSWLQPHSSLCLTEAEFRPPHDPSSFSLSIPQPVWCSFVNLSLRSMSRFLPWFHSLNWPITSALSPAGSIPEAPPSWGFMVMRAASTLGTQPLPFPEARISFQKDQRS